MSALCVLQKQESGGEDVLCGLGRQVERRPSRRKEGSALVSGACKGPNDAAATLEAVAGCAASAHQGLSST